MINTLHVGKLDRHQNDKYITCGEIICKFKAALLDFCSVFGPTTSYIYTKQQLKPYKEYDFRIKATNSHGSTYSPWVMLVTLQDSELNYHMILSILCL